MLEKTSERKYRIPEGGRVVDYATYREITGKCETCGAKMDSHPECDACGALCGTGHLDWIPSSYHEHNLCGHCIASWEKLDKVIERETTWSEFLNPQPKMFSEEGDKEHA